MNVDVCRGLIFFLFLFVSFHARCDGRPEGAWGAIAHAQRGHLPRRAAAAGAARTVGQDLQYRPIFFLIRVFCHPLEDQGQRLPTLRGLPTRDTWVVPVSRGPHQGLLTRSATNSYESTPRGSEGFGSPATAGCGQGAARVTPQATSPRARRPGCRARTARRGGAVDDRAHVYIYVCIWG